MHLRVTAESLTQLRRHPNPRRYALVTLFCYSYMRNLTDRLIELLLQLVHKMGTQAEKRVDEELLTDFKRVTGKTRLLFQMAAVALDHPAEAVQEVIYPVVGVETLRNLVTEGAATGHFYRDKVQRVMQGSYRGIHLRRDTLCLQPLSVMIGWRFRGRGKSSMFDNTVSKRSGNPRLKNRAAGVVPSAARQSKLCSTVHTLERRLGKPR